MYPPKTPIPIKPAIQPHFFVPPAIMSKKNIDATVKATRDIERAKNFIVDPAGILDPPPFNTFPAPRTKFLHPQKPVKWDGVSDKYSRGEIIAKNGRAIKPIPLPLPKDGPCHSDEAQTRTKQDSVGSSSSPSPPVSPRDQRTERVRQDQSPREFAP